MTGYSSIDIAQKINGIHHGKGISNIHYISIDSRSITHPENTIFIALKGQRNDGHTHINEVYNLGVRCFIVNKDFNNLILSDSCFISCSNTLHALQTIAAKHRSVFKIPIIGITGSNGKTIIKEWLNHCLSQKYSIVRSPRSYNSQVGVPLSVWQINDTHTLGIFEAGISLKDEMMNLEPIIKPTLGIFTNIGDAHQENFKSIEEKISEKLKLFKNTSTLIYRSDNELLDEVINKTLPLIEKFSWSTTKKATLKVLSTIRQGKKTTLEAIYNNQLINCTIPFVDEASIENAIHVWCCLLHLNIESSIIQDRMNDLVPVAMRMELKKGKYDSTIINDSYNSDINSIEIALNYLIQQPQNTIKIVILSDILQSGISENDLYTRVGSILRNKNIDQLIGIGSKISKNANFIGFTNAKYFKTTDEFIEKGLTFKDSAILCKGAREFRFEKIVTYLEEKHNRTQLEININSLIHNLNYFKSIKNKAVKTLVMVKAFSYGSGTYEIAGLLANEGVDYLGVAFTDEGIALREKGIKLPIIVMNPEENAFEEMIKYELEPQLYSIDQTRQLLRYFTQQKIINYKVHVKLDTGMHRSGFEEKDLPLLIPILKSKEINVASVFSHLAAADEPMHDDFTKEQIHRFNTMNSIISNELNYSYIRHLCNSAGTERFPEAHYEMVRLGIGLYGISAVEQTNVKNISRLTSYISQIRIVTPPETIGYSRKGKIDQPTRIAIMPIGYADGLRRSLSNGIGKVRINSQYAPIIGNICMDICMANITNIDAEIGEEVVFFDEELSIQDMATKLNTIPYEILTSISPRVKRVYVRE